jgi:hypothetical protein
MLSRAPFSSSSRLRSRCRALRTIGLSAFRRRRLHALLRMRLISLSFGARLNFLCPLVNSFTLLRANNPDFNSEYQSPR